MADAGVQPEQDVELPPDFPQCYLGFCKGDKRKALDLYNHGQELRSQLKLDELDAPFPLFEQLQAQYPIALHGKAKTGEYLLVQRPGALDVGKLKASGATREDVVRYFAYHVEFLLRKIDANAQLIMVIDMDSLGLLKLMSSDFIAVIRSISDTLSSVYCRKVKSYIVARPPAIFDALWKILSTVLPAGASDNFTVCADANALEAFIEPGGIPTEFGGSLPLGEAEEQKQLKAHVASRT